MEKLLKKDVTFCWNDDFMKSMDVLKGKLVSTPILVFPKWDVEFNVHVDASCIVLGTVVTQDGGECLDQPITFASRRLSKAEKNYSTTEHEGLAMVSQGTVCGGRSRGRPWAKWLSARCVRERVCVCVGGCMGGRVCARARVHTR